MKYVPPLGAPDDNDPYVNPNPVAGIDGSPVPAAAIEHTMREITHVITQAGLTPDEGDLTQLYQAINDLIIAASSENKLLIIEDQKPNGTSGQSLTANTWNKRILNTVVRNDFGGSPLVNSQITLMTGDYEMFYFLVHRAGTEAVAHRVRDVTNNIDLSLGLSGDCDNAASSANFVTSKFQTFTLTDTAVIEVQSNPINAGIAGTASTRGIKEVYAQIVLRKVA